MAGRVPLPSTPLSTEQTAGWAEVVKAVKAEPVHGAFFLQLWHMGRQSHSTYASVSFGYGVRACVHVCVWGVGVGGGGASPGVGTFNLLTSRKVHATSALCLRACPRFDLD